MKNLIPLTFLSLFLFPSVGFAQSGPPIGYTWHENTVNGHHYALTNKDMSWTDVAAEADSLGPDVEMVTIRSEGENTWIFDTFLPHATNAYLWIGYSDYLNEGAWVWRSGEITGYSKWMSGQPDNAGNNEHYAELRLRDNSTPGNVEKWNDYQGHFSSKGVLEWIPPNLPPLAVDDLATVEEGAVVNIDVLANDTDPEGDPLTVLSNTNPTFGTAVIVGDQIEYTPIAGWHGTDFFDYEIEDTFGGRDTATVTVTIAEKTRLIIDPIVAGGTATFHIEECEPKSWFFLCWSFTGSGPTTIGGHFNTFDLQLSVPIGSLDPITLNPFGMGQIGPVSVPTHIFPGTQVWFQGVVLDISGGAGLVVTNMVPITVQ